MLKNCDYINYMRNENKVKMGQNWLELFVFDTFCAKTGQSFTVNLTVVTVFDKMR